MRRSLTIKLMLAFLAISLTGAALAALIAWRATAVEFDRYVIDRAQNTFVAQAAAYYESNGSWSGFVEQVQAGNIPAETGYQPADPHADGRAAPDASGRPPPQQEPLFLLADANGRVIYAAGPYRVGEQVSSADLQRGTPVTVDSSTVGTVVAMRTIPPLDPREARYISSMNQALILGAMGGAAIALVLGIVLARTLTYPLRELTTAIRAVARGELEQEVPVRSHDELGELTRAFNQMSTDLARANQLRRQMTADIAHDLRTPLTVIAGYLEGLRDGVLKPSPERFEVIYSEARHLQHLVDDLRILSLADAGELSLNRQPVAPQALLERLAAAYTHQAAQRRIVLSIEAAPGLPDLMLDPERMAQVLGNLISNALRYTPPGGHIVLGAQQHNGSISLTVQDDGTGISAEDLPRIFDRFYRSDMAREQQNGESGLGLAIARSLVEVHGGTIGVQSTPQQGTTFTLDLPLAQAGAEPQA